MRTFPMSDRVTRWLEELGLGRYADAFAEQEVAYDDLGDLTDADLKELDIPLGPRKRLLRAIEQLDSGPAPKDHLRESSSRQWPKSDNAERRQLTVMFCDLADSTELSQRLDPEDLREVNRGYQDACKRAIERYEGYVARYMGDGVLAYFGYPQAHEDDAERAIHAGLRVVDAMTGLNETVGHGQSIALRVRVGIATGPVVVGDLIGEGASQESAVVGETPNLAARLQALACEDSVVIGPGTRDLAGKRFEYDDLGTRQLKGIAEPVRAWRVIAPTSAESRFEVAHGTGLTPLVGREHEIGLLLDRWARAKEGDGQIVLLSGEVGIGKSRITEVLREHTTTDSPVLLRYQCSPYYTNSALRPVIEQLGRAAQIVAEDTSEAKLDKLEALLIEVTPDVQAVAPLLAALLSIPSGDRYAPLEMTPERQKEATLKALAGQMAGLSRHHPVLLIFEDVHWADPTSLELLKLVIERGQDLPILVVITFRPEFSPPWKGYTHVTSLTLNRFNRSLAAKMVEKVAVGKRFPEEIFEKIVSRTDGVPLFVEELTKAILESGLVTESPTEYVLSGSLSEITIPATLHDSLMARLDRLGAVKDVAQTASAIGREFDYDLLAAVSQLSTDELAVALDSLVNADLVYRRGPSRSERFSFRHALIQDAAHASLLKSKRRKIHARIAEALEKNFPERVIAAPELLAHHWTQARRHELAIPYWEKAGQLAIDCYANKEAAGHLKKALELCQDLPDGPARRQRELQLLVSLGLALQVSLGHPDPQVGETYRRAYTLCRELQDTRHLTAVLHGLRQFHMTRGELRTALEVSEELLDFGEKLDSNAYRLEGHRALGCQLYWLGELGTARTHLENAIELQKVVTRGDHVGQYDSDPVQTALGYLAQTLWSLGLPEQAHWRSEQALALARSGLNSYHIIEALRWDAELWLLRRDGQRTHDRAKEALNLANEHGFPFYQGFAKYLLGWAVARMGDVDAGCTCMREAISHLSSIGNNLMSYRPAPLAETLERAGMFNEGLVVVGDALNAVREIGCRIQEAELYRIKGCLLHQAGRHESEAENCFELALAISRDRSARYFELRTALSLARLRQSQGKPEAAIEILVPVYRWFTEGLNIPDLEEARTLIEALS